MSNNNTTTDVNHHTPSCNVFVWRMPWFHRKSFVYIIIFKKAGDFQVDKTDKNPLIIKKKGIPPAIKTLQPTKTTSPPQKKKISVSPAKSGVLDNNSLSSFRVERKARARGHKLDIPLKPEFPARRPAFHRRLLAKSKKKCSRLCLSVWKV